MPDPLAEHPMTDMADSSPTAAAAAVADPTEGSPPEFGMESQEGRIETGAPTETDVESTSFPNLWRHPVRAGAWVVRLLFGLLSLTLALAFIAAIPVVNFLALGYLLEVEGRVGRSGRFRDAFPLLDLAPRLGSVVLGVWLWLLPLRFLAEVSADAHIIDPGGAADLRMELLVRASWILVTAHLCLALARGGGLFCFVRPIKNVRWLWKRLRDGDYFETASEHVRRIAARLRLGHHFWLGVRGFVGALGWLIVPTFLFVAAEGTEPGPVLVTLLGGLVLAVTLSWVPFLQARLATENRFVSAFAVGDVRRLFHHAPLAWLAAVAVVYVLALPLYLFKAFVLPQDALWPITLIFIVSIYPARVVTGWAYHRAVRRREAGRRSGKLARWTARAGMVPLLAAFVYLLYLTRFIGADGTQGLFEHHAFLLPWPGDPTN